MAQPAVPTSGYQVPPAGYQVPGPGYQMSGAPLPSDAPRCRFCGCRPAATVRFRGHQGMVVMMRFLSVNGPFCRDCGLATFRRMTARTLVQGWWGYASFIITPVTILINVVRRAAVAGLAPPRREAGVPAPMAAPMDPGPPLLYRPMALIGLFIPPFLVLALVLLIVAGNS